MIRAARLLGLVAAVLLVLGGCEDNEHPFDGWWGVSCPVTDAPAMAALFQDPRQLDDSGSHREYVGRIEVSGPDFPDVWVWQIEVDVNHQTATTVVLEHVPVPDEYVTGEPFFQDLDFDVRTYAENPEQTAATMTGECTYGEESADLTLQQFDTCDLCFDCDTGGTPASAAGLLAPLLLLTARRRAAPPRSG